MRDTLALLAAVFPRDPVGVAVDLVAFVNDARLIADVAITVPVTVAVTIATSLPSSLSPDDLLYLRRVCQTKCSRRTSPRLGYKSRPGEHRDKHQ